MPPENRMDPIRGWVFSQYRHYMKRNIITLSVFSILLFGFQPSDSKLMSRSKSLQEETDTIIWREAIRFTKIFNERDTSEMNKLLPDDFMLQWIHDNFLGKKNILNMMMDTAVHSTFKHILHRDAQTIIRYSDDNSAAGLNVAIDFLDPVMAESVKKEHGFGLSIMYFQKRNGKWWLKTVHLDLHCSLCNE
jgi:hypothetical protein